ncbi:MAG: hypothetical protein H0X66_16230 [Verrucomicrobia bacterium]|nr:hypothetical protein [Verrucomicrobiota bacterium]
MPLNYGSIPCAADVSSAEKHAGTPQGGLISPLLANFALDGMEQAVKAVAKRGDKVNFVRYADHFVVTGATRELYRFSK